MIDLSAREEHEASHPHAHRPRPHPPKTDVLPKTAHRLRRSNATTPETRDNEWLLARIMVAWGLVLTLPGDSLSGPAFSEFHRFPWMTETFWAALFCGVGCLRLFALYVNGKSPRSPIGRMIGAFFGIVIWLWLACLILEGNYEQLRSIPPGVAIYGMFVIAECRSLYRASYDARYQPRH